MHNQMCNVATEPSSTFPSTSVVRRSQTSLDLPAGRSSKRDSSAQTFGFAKQVGLVVTKGTSSSTHLTVVYGTNKASRGAENQVKLQRAHGGCLGTRRR